MACRGTDIGCLGQVGVRHPAVALQAVKDAAVDTVEWRIVGRIFHCMAKIR
jgi:hypothetical protein